jgi:hypothetical protein
MEEGRNPSPEDMRTKVIPDLLVYAAWLAEEFGVKIEDAYLTRFMGNLKRLYSDKISPEELAGLEGCVSEKLQMGRHTSGSLGK